MAFYEDGAGCKACKEGIAAAGPEPRRLGASADGWTFLAQCSQCDTFWVIDVRAARRITSAEARAGFPNLFADE